MSAMCKILIVISNNNIIRCLPIILNVKINKTNDVISVFVMDLFFCFVVGVKPGLDSYIARTIDLYFIMVRVPAKAK